MLKKLSNLKTIKKLDTEDLKKIKGGELNTEPCMIMCPVDYSCKWTTCYPPDHQS